MREESPFPIEPKGELSLESKLKIADHKINNDPLHSFRDRDLLVNLAEEFRLRGVLGNILGKDQLNN